MIPEAHVVDPHGQVVVYTAITGGYDRLKRQPRSATESADFVAFCNAPTPPGSPWRARAIHAEFQDPARNAKIHKILPHRYFPAARYSLWMDGSVTILFPHSVQRLIELYLADCDLAVLPHRTRSCLYQEADVCLRRNLDDPDVIWRQICRYTQEGYPPNAGLAECTVVLRRHTPMVEAFNEAWWGEILHGSRRDQLSFPYAARQVGLTYRTFPQDLVESRVFRRPPAHVENLLFHRSRHTATLVSHVRLLIARRSGRYASRVSAMIRARLISILTWAEVRPSPLRSSLRRFTRTLAGGSIRRASPRSRLLAGLASVLPSRARGHPMRSVDGGAWTAALPDGDTRSWTSVRGFRRRVVALGPVRDVPSWSWVGFDTARELARYYDVALFHTWSTVPDCDVLLVVKDRPPERFVDAARGKQSKLVYCPIDVHRSHDHLAGDADFLRACDLVLVHSERLQPLVRPYCERTHFVEHHTRFALPAMADYKDAGYVLWVGGFQYVPYLLRWLEIHPLRHDLRILTDFDNHRARHAARLFAAEIGMPLALSRGATAISGYPIFVWSERRQAEMMRECKATLDAKLTDDFNQHHKPPTKAQQMIASGIPFAINGESYSTEYFRLRGFEVASPADTTRWFSRDYWEATRRCGESLRARTSLQAVGARYRELIDSL